MIHFLSQIIPIMDHNFTKQTPSMQFQLDLLMLMFGYSYTITMSYHSCFNSKLGTNKT
uniref:Pco127259 n=1 Tax=Arundo donax TaxID=35708 RepID=A0A0A9ESV1_ARUDO